ncbi:MAG: hypothetical protein V1870_05400 [Candidatus Aenigmatarchaeota archaeon]
MMTPEMKTNYANRLLRRSYEKLSQRYPDPLVGIEEFENISTQPVRKTENSFYIELL